MPETHIASGKIREIYAIDDERLLLVASDRISRAKASRDEATTASAVRSSA